LHPENIHFKRNIFRVGVLYNVIQQSSIFIRLKFIAMSMITKDEPIIF